MTEHHDSLAPVDPRRALGRRPGAHAPPRLLIDDSVLNDVSPSPTPHISLSSETQHVELSHPSQRRDVSLESLSPSSPALRRFRRPNGKPKEDKVAQRGLYETQKMLSHLLDRLARRPSAPDLLDRAAIHARESSSYAKRKTKGKIGKLGQVVVALAHTGMSIAQGGESTNYASGISSEDLGEQPELQDGVGDTEETCDLVEQTRSLLVLADKQGLDLFTSDTEISETDPQIKPTKRKAGRFASFANPGSPTSLASPKSLSTAGTTGSISGQGLLERLMGILSSLIRVDCLHQTSRFRPLRPPNGLQAACLDIAAYVYEQGGLSVKVEALEVVVDAFYTMSGTMTERLCEWLEGRLAELLNVLAHMRSGREPDGTARASTDDPFGSQDGFTNERKVAVYSETPYLDAPASSPGWLRYSPTSPNFRVPGVPGILSSHASTVEPSPPLLNLASLVTRLLLAISETADMASSKLTTIHRIHRLLSLVLTAKPDSSLDLLDIVAHASERSRRTAIDLLATYFPESIGHNVIARNPTLATYAAQLARWETGSNTALGEDSPGKHHYVPWRVSSNDGPASATFGNKCGTCCNEIHGFCVKCTLCRELRHLHCFQQDSDIHGFRCETVNSTSESSASSFVDILFSPALSRLEKKTISDSLRRGAYSTRTKLVQHDLRLVNLFTTTLCCHCHLPIWGITDQAYACFSGCQKLFHPNCIDSPDYLAMDECKGTPRIRADAAAGEAHRFSIRHSDLVDSFQVEGGYLCVRAEELDARSYDEVAILYGALWSQYQLLKHGVQSRSIRVSHKDGSISDADLLGLRPYLNSYDEHLRLNDTSGSLAAADFALIVNGGVTLGQGYLFSDRFLLYCTALLRSPSNASALGEAVSETPSHRGNETNRTYEALPLPTLARSLATDLNILDPATSTLFLNHLKINGLITVAQQKTIFPQDLLSSSAMSSFGLPVLMDTSPMTEILITAIEALFDDLDLCMNEVGLSLAVNRGFPSLLCSPYALERLGGALIRWVFSEDETVHRVMRDYASKHKRLPGVRDGTRGNSSVQIYQEDRRALRRRYALPWLTALHNQDPALFAHTVYDQCKMVDNLTEGSSEHSEDTAVRIASTALDRMSDLTDAGFLFSMHLDLLIAWLEDLGTLAGKNHVYRSLPRLVNRIATARHEEDQNIWTLSQNTVTEGREGVSRVCRWVRVLAFSGVEVPWALLSNLADRLALQDDTVRSYLDLVIAITANSAPVDPAEFGRLCCRIFVDFADSPARTAPETESTLGQDVLIRSMLVISRAYGVSPTDVAATRLGSVEMTGKQPPSEAKKRKATILPALLEMDEGLILSVSSLLIQGIYPKDILLDFLWLLFARATSVANIDGFLHKQCSVLYPILWGHLDSSDHRSSRARVFLRLLAINATPLENKVKQQFHSGDRARLRERLLRFVLELADAEISKENLGWKRASVGLIILFFEALLDHSDVNPDNLVGLHSILPSHLKAITGCFEEYLVQSSDEQRLSLLSRLHRLRTVLPSWPVLSWAIIDDLLVETASSISKMAPANSATATSAHRDAQSVQANVIALGLDMLAAGVPIPWGPAQRLQQHVAQTIVRPWPEPNDHITMLILPAVRSVLDSAHHIAASNQVIEGTTKPRKTVIVGAIFLPIVIDFGPELKEKHGYMTKRALLDILNVVFFKHGSRPVELPALSALQSMAEFCRDGKTDENRLYGLSILQMAITRAENESLARAIPSIFCTIADLLVQQTTDEGDAAVAEQSQALLRMIIKQFGRSRLFVQLFKHDATVSQISKTDMRLGKALQILRVAGRSGPEEQARLSIIDLAFTDLPDVLKGNRQVLQQVLESFERFVKCIEGEISETAAGAFGQLITRLGKHVAEWDMAEFDPNPILRTCAMVIDLTPSGPALLLLHQAAIFLHLSMSRFSVRWETACQLLMVLDQLARTEKTDNTIRSDLEELAGSALHGSLIPPVTLGSLLQYVNTEGTSDRSSTSGGSASAQANRLLSGSAAGCLAILLRTHPSLALPDTPPEATLSILVRAGLVLVQAETLIPGTVSQHLASIVNEAAITQLNVFIYILLASLQLSMGSGRDRLVALYPVLGRAISLCLRASADLLAVSDIAGDGAENLSVVFAVFRLALLAAVDPPALLRNASADESGPDAGRQSNKQAIVQAVENLWLRIWSDWYRLIGLSLEPNCVNGPLRVIAGTVFLDTLIFMHKVQSPILSTHAGALNHALHKLHRASGTLISGQGGSKMIKAELAVREAGTDDAEVDVEGMINTIWGDLLAAERLRALRHLAEGRRL